MDKNTKFWKSMTRSKLIEELQDSWDKKDALIAQENIYKKTIIDLDKVLLEKELDLRNYKQNHSILTQRNDALQSALSHFVLELRRMQTEHTFKPDNQMRFEFKDGKWQTLPFDNTTDSISLAG